MKNKYEARGNDYVIFLDRRDGSIVETLISGNQLEKAMSFNGKWYAYWSKLNSSFYVVGNVKIGELSTTFKLHRFLLDCPTELYVDHINHDTLDNRDFNIRKVTPEGNRHNSLKIPTNNTSGYTGVSLNKDTGKWKAAINVKGKSLYLGLYTDKEDAKKAVDMARSKLMPTSQERIILGVTETYTQELEENKKCWSTNKTSGLRNINFCSSANRWKVRITENGKRKCLGEFRTLEKAKKALEEAREVYSIKKYRQI